jgi:hypothetical protein
MDGSQKSLAPELTSGVSQPIDFSLLFFGNQGLKVKTAMLDSGHVYSNDARRSREFDKNL